MNDFYDINIIDASLSHPTIPFPCTTTIAQNITIFNNLFFKLTAVNFRDVYGLNESLGVTNKYTPDFNNDLKLYMRESITNDPKFTQLCEHLVQEELDQNLIEPDAKPARLKQIRDFLLTYYELENEKNVPSFKSENFLRVCYITMMKLMSNIFPEGIWCSSKQFNELFSQYRANPQSIIFTPSHKSHIDYILIHLILIRFQMAVPMVIAGDNLNVTLFGPILKNLGAVFIKRNFYHEFYTHRNYFNLIRYIVDRKVNLEVFIEGTRSRNGKLLLPKYGILKQLTDSLKAFKEEGVPNGIKIVPMSIQYEKVYENDGYIRELIGYEKKPETFARILFNGIKNFKLTSSPRVQNTNYLGKIYVTLNNVIEVNTTNVDDQNLTDLGFRILRDINRAAYLSEVFIIGYSIQLYYYLHSRAIFSLEELLPTFKWVLHETLLRDKQVNSNNNNRIELEKLIHVSDEQLENLIAGVVELFFKMIAINKRDGGERVIVIQSTIELLYYKNSLLHLFIDRAMVIFVLDKLAQTMDDFDTKYAMVKKLLAQEFLIQDDDDHKSNIIRQLIVDGKLSVDSDNCHFKVLDRDYFLKHTVLLMPYFESYHIMFEKMGIYMNRPFDYKKLVKTIHSMRTAHLESINSQGLHNNIETLKELGVLDVVKNKRESSVTIADVGLYKSYEAFTALCFADGNKPVSKL